MALPVFSTDTEEEARQIQTTFCTLVSHGELAGRHVIYSVNRADTDSEALAAMDDIYKKMCEIYKRMKARQKK